MKIPKSQTRDNKTIQIQHVEEIEPCAKANHIFNTILIRNVKE